MTIMDMNLVIVAMIVDLAAWVWVTNRGFIMNSNGGNYKFSKRFIKRQGLKEIGFNDKKFIFDSYNVFSWEITRETPFSFYTKSLSRLPYKKRNFKDLYRDFNSAFNDHVTLILNVSHKCNMSCVYCCAGGGSYGGRQKLMSVDIALKAVDLIAKNITRLTVIFFGGEPMLNQAILLTTTKYIIEKAKSNGINVDFHLSTNGTISFKKLKAICDLVKVNDFEVIVSIDGPAEVQNKNRPLKNGEPSFDIVYSNL
jgi:sulfatase maturation enzyme AslB (radical SAM superfamily)